MATSSKRIEKPQFSSLKKHAVSICVPPTHGQIKYMNDILSSSQSKNIKCFIEDQTFSRYFIIQFLPLLLILILIL